MLYFIAFFGTILFCAIRDGTKKRRQKERENAAIQAQAQAARQKELDRREKFQIQIERENARRKALETREREKREKARAQKELAKRELARVDAITDFYKLQLSDIENQIDGLQALIELNYSKHNNGQAELDEAKLEKLRKSQAQTYNKIAMLETKADRLSYKSGWNLM